MHAHKLFPANSGFPDAVERLAAIGAKNIVCQTTAHIWVTALLSATVVFVSKKKLMAPAKRPIAISRQLPRCLNLFGVLANFNSLSLLQVREFFDVGDLTMKLSVASIKVQE